MPVCPLLAGADLRFEDSAVIGMGMQILRSKTPAPRVDDPCPDWPLRILDSRFGIPDAKDSGFGFTIQYSRFWIPDSGFRIQNKVISDGKSSNVIANRYRKQFVVCSLPFAI